MLKPEDNKLLTRVGPGAAMGELLRRFWIPALMEEEVRENDGAPVRLRLLGQDLVAFRDTEGKLGILDAYCPHRRAHLYFGRNEECGLRCVYHGWKFNVTGQCVDMPSEQPGFKEKARTAAYPTATRGGVVWVYMGPDQLKPELPDFEWARLPKSRCEITKRSQQCNWAQAVEGGIDSSHISFLHRNLEDLTPAAKSTTGHKGYTSRDRSPDFTVKDTDYGLLIGASRTRTTPAKTLILDMRLCLLTTKTPGLGPSTAIRTGTLPRKSKLSSTLAPAYGVQSTTVIGLCGTRKMITGLTVTCRKTSTSRALRAFPIKTLPSKKAWDQLLTGAWRCSAPPTKPSSPTGNYFSIWSKIYKMDRSRRLPATARTTASGLLPSY